MSVKDTMTSMIVHAFPNRFGAQSRFEKKPRSFNNSPLATHSEINVTPVRRHLLDATPTLEPKKPRSLNDSPLATYSEINVSPMRRHRLDATPTLEPKKDIEYQTAIKRQNILFIVLDLHSQMNFSSMASLRAINNDVQIFTNISACFSFVQTTEDKIFLILTSNDKQLLEEFHQMKSIEAIFIFSNEAQVDSRFPKVFNSYTNYEELLMGLKDTLEWYEQTQMEIFVFERDQLFLWLQLWKSEFSKLSKLKAALNKTKLVEFAEKYYRGNARTMQIINEFDQNYAKNDAFHWCFSSPFPSRFLHRALHSHDIEQLSVCRFLLIDLSQKIQSINKKSNCELYKGMKMTADYVDKFEDHVGKLICSKGFLSCTQSRKQALDDANALDHRPDLTPVLFKISYDKSVSLFELMNKNNDSYFVSDVYTVFRVKYVNRSQMITIKIEVANEYGRKLAETYRMKHQSESVEDLLQELSMPPKSPEKLPSIQPIKLSTTVLSPPPKTKRFTPALASHPTAKTFSPSLSPHPIAKTFTPSLSPHPTTKECTSVLSPRQPLKRVTPLLADHILMKTEVNLEEQADEFLERGEIDQAIATYEQITPPSARIFNRIAAIYTQKKGDYESAIKFYRRALYIQEQNKEDVTTTLSNLGYAYQNCQKYDLALMYHSRALEKRKEIPLTDPADKAINLIGIANAYWGQKNLSQALQYAQDALTLNESIERGNDLNISANLAILANIYYASDETMKAIEVGQRALFLLERCVPSDSSMLATLLNNLATCQVAAGLFSDARDNYDRTLKIYQNIFPEHHPKRMAAQENLQRVIQMEENNQD